MKLVPGISACRHICSDTVTVLNEKLSFRKVRGANGAERDTRHIPQIESALDTHMGYHGQRHALMTLSCVATWARVRRHHVHIFQRKGRRNIKFTTADFRLLRYRPCNKNRGVPAGPFLMRLSQKRALAHTYTRRNSHARASHRDEDHRCAPCPSLSLARRGCSSPGRVRANRPKRTSVGSRVATRHLGTGRHERWAH